MSKRIRGSRRANDELIWRSKTFTHLPNKNIFTIKLRAMMSLWRSDIGYNDSKAI